MGQDSFVHKTIRPWPNRRLKRGAIVGHTTATSTRLWLRTGKKGSFSLLLFENLHRKDDDRFSRLKSVEFSLDNLESNAIRRDFTVTGFGKDTTHVEDIDGLRPDTFYGYALYSAEDERIIIGQDRVYFFRTMSDASKPFSFAFYSCHMPYDKTFFGNTNLKNIEMWNNFKSAIKRHNKGNDFKDGDFRFVIGGGDQVYSDGVDTLSIWSHLNSVMRNKNDQLLPTEEDMVTWYRDIYRGYWGFEAIQKVFSDFPVYMIWDDHELGDGCGSYFLNNDDKKELEALLPSIGNDGKPTYTEGLALYDRMINAAKQVYHEYQHSHNPLTPDGQYDYGFYLNDCAFYFLDGRGYRDVEQEQDDYRILGKKQFDHFKGWIESDETKSKKFLFVTAAVPIFHVRSVVANETVTDFFGRHGLSDDLRDSWEHDLHDKERKELTDLLFEAAGREQKVCILSGDVHIAAAFKLRNDAGKVIYQLTSSAITYN
ncbi:MAG: alkaline phosphatase family protein, partial [Deltaproteobacteria bacterium]|nr:alkaline phosphatase family protein [Deltaproteobacteria bacterium]